MKCRGCGYVLWGLKARVCPECGLAFTLSERVFVPGKVIFGCPTCGSAYLGKSEDGLPEPSEFACAGCAGVLRVDELVARPMDGAKGPVEIEPLPWIERKSLGPWRAWWRTGRSVWKRPRWSARGAAKTGRIGEALWFGAWTWMLASLVSLWGVVVIVWAGIGIAVAAERLFSPDLAVVIGIASSVLLVLVWVLPFLLLLSASGLVSHGILRITGDTRHGLRGTMQAVGYSSACASVSIVPCLWLILIPLALVLQCVFAGMMLSVIQRVSWWRAALAVAPMALVPGGVYVGGTFAPGLVALHSMHQAAASMLEGETQAMRYELDAFEVSHGAPASHGLDLVERGTARVEFFVRAQVMFGGGGVFYPLTPHIESQLRQRWDAQRSAMPKDVIAHRMGQFVFTHHGQSAQSNTRLWSNSKLWILIGAPIPVSEDILGTFRGTGHAAFDGSMVAVTRGGQTEWFAKWDIPNALAAQNAVRAREGLPPLPNPFTILEGSPAVAGGAGGGPSGASPPTPASVPTGSGPTP